jgi:PGF-CTERM protein/surface glycoprotein (TIGR04207 family)
MTNNSDKIRSVVLAALMMFSVFAGTVALTGTAAAGTADTGNSSITPSTVDESTTNTHTVTLVATGVNTSGNGDQVLAVDLPDVLDTSNSDVTNVNVNSGDVTYNGTSNVNDTNDVVTVTLQDDNGVNSDTVNVTFDLTNVAAPSVNSNTSAQAQMALDENADGNYSGSNDDGFTDFQQLTIVDTSSTSDQNASVVNGSIVYQGQTVEAIGFAANEDVILSTGTPSDTGTFKNRYTADTDGVIRFSTSNLETGQNYVLQGNDGNGEKVGFQVVDHDLSVDVADSEIGNAGGTTTTTATFDSNRQSFDVYVSAENLSASDVEMIVDDSLGTTLVDTDGDGTDDAVEVTVERNTDYTLNASGIDAGDYTLEFDVVDTTSSVSADLSVTDVGSGEASFAQGSFTVPQGDVAQINISLDGAAAGTGGTLVIGNEESDGYQANVSFTDDGDGQVVIQFNTYAAGSDSNGTVVEAAGDDSVTFDNSSDQTQINNILAQGDYTLSVSTAGNAEDTVDQPQDLGALAIGPRSTDSMSLWTAPSQATIDTNSDGEVTEDDIATLIEDDMLTQDDSIAAGDFVVHQITATGLEGVTESEGGLSGALMSDSLSLSIVQTNPVQNQDAKEVNVTASANNMMFVEGDGAYYIVANTDNLVLEDTSKDIVAGDEFRATFTVADDRLLRSSDAAAHESVNATFTVEEATTELDADPVEVAAASNQTITGTTNLAPGTELTVRVRSSSDVTPGFYDTDTVTVQADGTFSAEFDFSEQAAGDTFDVTVRRGGNTVATADGEIVESTTTPTPSEGTDTPSEDTETATPTATATATPSESTETATPSGGDDTETEPPEDTTTTTTPGFGVAVALVALLAAALLAGRRE